MVVVSGDCVVVVEASWRVEKMHIIIISSFCVISSSSITKYDYYYREEE